MAKIKVIHERYKCIGCTACSVVCSENWVMNDDGKSDLKNSKHDEKKDIQTKELDNIGCNKKAAEACPVDCIHVEEDGKRLI